MSEGYILLEGLPANHKFLINKEEWVVEDDGSVMLSQSLFQAEKINPIVAFEEELTELLTDIQRMKLYNLWGTGSAIKKSATVNILNGDRELAKKTISIGESHGILTIGHNFTWKVIEKVVKERMVLTAKALKDRLYNTEQKTGQEHLEEVLRKSREEDHLAAYVRESIGESTGEETTHDPEIDGSIKESMEKKQQAASSTMKEQASHSRKIVHSPKKKSPLSKPLVSTPKRM